MSGFDYNRKPKTLSVLNLMLVFLTLLLTHTTFIELLFVTFDIELLEIFYLSSVCIDACRLLKTSL